MYKKIRLILTLLLTALLLLGLVSTAWAVPPIPSSFYGEIHVLDNPPSVGDQVLAYVPGVTGSVGSATIQLYGSELVYSIDVLGDDTDISGKDGGEEGDIITFEINGRVVATATWHSGTNVNLVFHPPDPVVTNTGPVNEGSAVTIDASASADWGIDLSTYEFDCDNDSTYEIGPQSGATAQCTFDDNGAYTVGVRVTDLQGGVGTDSTMVTVNNVAPTATFNAPAAVDEGGDIDISLTVPYDPSSADTSAGFDYCFDCGSGYGAWGASNTAACPTTDDGSVTVKGKIRDKDLAETEYTTDVTVNNVAPTATFNAPAAVDEGQDINLSLTVPYDPSSADTSAGFDYCFDCGSGYGVWGASNTATCLTTDDGSVTVKGKIRDKDLAETEYTDTVTVNNVAPTATFNAPAAVDEGGDIDISLTVPYDPSSADTSAGFDYCFDCGSGYGAWGASNTAACPTTDDGSVTVKGKIRDKDLAETEYTDTVTVNDVPPTNVDAHGPYNGIAGQPVSLTGSATCASVDTCTYAWDLDDDGHYDDATGESPNHTWNTVGDYTIGLQVTDDDGNPVTDSADVHISGDTHSIGLEVGWNLVSFNLQPVSTVITDVLSDIEGNYSLVYAWDAPSEQWLKYDPSVPYGDTLTNLDETMGFWIQMTSTDTLDVVGSVPTTTDINLYSAGAGWNLVGYPSAVNRDLPDVLEDHGVGTDFSLVYAYHADDLTDQWKLFDRTGPEYANDLTYLSPGWGYWVKVSADHIWNVAYPAP